MRKTFIAYRLIPGNGGYAITTADAPDAWLTNTAFSLETAMKLIRQFERLDKESLAYRMQEGLLSYIL